MIRRWIFLIALVLLGFALFYNPNFKTVSAGVAILLFGMVTLEEGFKVFAKGPLKKVLKRATDKVYKSITAGALVTALVQSSSLVSVITISFISAGLITLFQGIGLVYGSNIGTTFTAWLIAGFGLKIDIAALAFPMLVFGIIFSFQKNKSTKGLGNVLTGLGFFFLGIFYMKEGFDVFSQYIDLTQYAMRGPLGVLVYFLLGILITAILQSSSASMALILTALSAGQITYENSLALAIGSNVGTTITALIGSIGSNIAGKRLAIAHLIFNLFTGLIALVFIRPLAQLVNRLSDWFSIGAQDYILKLAVFHTLFNLLGVVLMLPLMRWLERFLIKRIKGPKEKDIDEPKFLNQTALEFPETVVSTLEKESKYLFENAIYEIVSHGLNLHRSDLASSKKMKAVVKASTADLEVDVRALYIQKVKSIYGQILEFATKAQMTLDLEKQENERISGLKIANRKMVEVLRYTTEFRKNVIFYAEFDNPYVKKQYQGYRRIIAKMLRALLLFKEEYSYEEGEALIESLKEANRTKLIRAYHKISPLIRDNLIDARMASSLVNDQENVKNITLKLLEISELLYLHKDPILEDSEST